MQALSEVLYVLLGGAAWIASLFIAIGSFMLFRRMHDWPTRLQVIGSVAFFTAAFFEFAIDWSVIHGMLSTESSPFYSHNLLTSLSTVPPRLLYYGSVCFPVGFFWHARRVY